MIIMRLKSSKKVKNRNHIIGFGNDIIKSVNLLIFRMNLLFL